MPKRLFLSYRYIRNIWDDNQTMQEGYNKNNDRTGYTDHLSQFAHFHINQFCTRILFFFRSLHSKNDTEMNPIISHYRTIKKRFESFIYSSQISIWSNILKLYSTSNRLLLKQYNILIIIIRNVWKISENKYNKNYFVFFFWREGRIFFYVNGSLKWYSTVLIFFIFGIYRPWELVHQTHVENANITNQSVAMR